MIAFFWIINYNYKYILFWTYFIKNWYKGIRIFYRKFFYFIKINWNEIEMLTIDTFLEIIWKRRSNSDNRYYNNCCNNLNSISPAFNIIVLTPFTFIFACFVHEFPRGCLKRIPNGYLCFRKDVRLPVQFQRAMAMDAEAARKAI